MGWNGKDRNLQGVPRIIMEKLYRFTSPTCQPCKVLSKTLEDMHLDIPIEVIDISVYPELIQEYLIKSVPTLYYKGNYLTGNKTKSEIYEWLAEIE